MKSKKKKLSDKLKSLKDGITLPEASVLDEEIVFEREEHQDVASSIVEASQVEDQPQAHTRVSHMDSTNLISSHDKTQATTNIDDADRTEVSNNESTFHEITAGRQVNDSERVSYGDVYETEESMVGKEMVGNVLKQVEQLRLAQEKINDLESEIEDLRRENDEILTAADTFKVLSEDYFEQLERLKTDLVETKEIASQENKILKDSLQERDRVVRELKQVNADLKAKVETNFKQIRKRERDLEYRLEMAKVEETTLLKTKDKSILELRRKVDKLEQEADAYREKNKEHYQKLQQQQQTVRGVVRALRIALTRLEGDFGVDFEILKKAE